MSDEREVERMLKEFLSKKKKTGRFVEAAKQ